MAKIGFVSGTSDGGGSDLGDLLVSRSIFSEAGLWTCGYNTTGTLGTNDRTHRSSPVQTISTGSIWKNCGSGIPIGFLGGIRLNGTLWLWGKNDGGQLGTNNLTHRSSPVQTVAQGSTWKTFSSGLYHSTAIKTDGTLWLWGDNSVGELANNSIVTPISSPIQTYVQGNTWKQSSAGYNYTAAIKTDGTLWTWGFNSVGQLGTNDTTNYSSPVQTVSTGTTWKQASCGGLHLAAIKTDGTLWTWGGNVRGPLGTNDTTNYSSPVQTVLQGNNWKQVSCGYTHTAAVKTDGTLWTWGYNFNGELGTNARTHRSTPGQTVTQGTNWKSVSCGYFDTSCIKTDGTLWLWGKNDNGILGTNDITHRSSPVQTLLQGTNWKQVSLSDLSLVAVRDDSLPS